MESNNTSTVAVAPKTGLADLTGIRILAHSKRKTGSFRATIGAKTRDGLVALIAFFEDTPIKFEGAVKTAAYGFVANFTSPTEKALRGAVRIAKGSDVNAIFKGKPASYLTRIEEAVSETEPKLEEVAKVDSKEVLKKAVAEAPKEPIKKALKGATTRKKADKKKA